MHERHTDWLEKKPGALLAAANTCEKEDPRLKTCLIV